MTGHEHPAAQDRLTLRERLDSVERLLVTADEALRIGQNKVARPATARGAVASARQELRRARAALAPQQLEAVMNARNPAFDRAFWQAVDDMHLGVAKPIESYLSLVPSHERDDLARMLRPHARDYRPHARDYRRGPGHSDPGGDVAASTLTAASTNTGGHGTQGDPAAPEERAFVRDDRVERSSGGETPARSAATTLVIGGERSEAADRVLDAITAALQEFDTETLLAVADYRESVWKDCWMPPLLHQYVEVHRGR